VCVTTPLVQKVLFGGFKFNEILELKPLEMR